MPLFPNKSITYLSKGFESIFGIPAEAVLGKSWQTIINWLPESLEIDIEKIAEMQKILSSQELEMSFVNPHGKIRTISIVRHPVCNEAGDLFAIEGLAEDITQRKADEAELLRSNAELERATRLKDEFLANMSHELRTPLNSILGMTEGLLEGMFGPINTRQRKALKTVENSGSHLLALINDILDVAKIEAGQAKLEYSYVAVELLCISAITFLKQQALKKQIKLLTKIQPNLPDLYVDEVRIRQVLLNLLSNAVKFTSEGGTVTLAVSLILPEPQSDQTSYLRFAVNDTGIGISPENISLLFQPFVQIDGALNRKYAGTGLGLTLVKQIVELHGGQVGLTSELGVGSCFDFDLPYPPETLMPRSFTEIAPTIDQSLTDTTPLTKSYLILLAEDDPANVETIRLYLEAKGYNLIFANDGQEAIALAISSQPDLILMDIQMPNIDGLEAIRQIRQQENICKIPIIALTALSMQGDRDRCLEAGANAYFSKPIRFKQLDNLIKEILQ